MTKDDLAAIQANANCDALKKFEVYVRQESRPLVPNTLSTTELDFLAISNALGGEVGELQNIVKKIIRADSYPSSDLWDEFVLEAGDVLHYYLRLLHNAGYPLEDVIDANISKLEERKNAAQTNTVSTSPVESRT